MRRGRDDAASLAEPQWHAVISIAANTANGEQHGHDISRPYPAYTPAETTRKIAEARRQDKPASCDRLARQFNAPHVCAACINKGIGNPIKLGYPTH